MKRTRKRRPTLREQVIAKKRDRLKRQIARLERQIKKNNDLIRSNLTLIFTLTAETTIGVVSRIPQGTIDDVTVMAAWDILRSRVEQGLSLESSTESFVSGLPDAEALVQMICASWTPALQRSKPDADLLLAVIDAQKTAVQQARGPQGNEYVQALLERLDAEEAKLQNAATDGLSPA